MFNLKNTLAFIKRNYIFIIAAVFYLLALLFPAFSYFRENNTEVLYSDTGLDVLSYGWIGIFFLHLEWYANLLAIISLSAIRKSQYKAALILSTTALILAFQTFTLTQFPADEAGNTNYISSLGPGAYLWMGALLLILLGCLEQYGKKR